MAAAGFTVTKHLTWARSQRKDGREALLFPLQSGDGDTPFADTQRVCGGLETEAQAFRLQSLALLPEGAQRRFGNSHL